MTIFTLRYLDWLRLGVVSKFACFYLFIDNHLAKLRHVISYFYFVFKNFFLDLLVRQFVYFFKNFTILASNKTIILRTPYHLRLLTHFDFGRFRHFFHWCFFLQNRPRCSINFARINLLFIFFKSLIYGHMKRHDSLVVI